MWHRLEARVLKIGVVEEVSVVVDVTELRTTRIRLVDDISLLVSGARPLALVTRLRAVAYTKSSVGQPSPSDAMALNCTE
jgi:hypothetical protein